MPKYKCINKECSNYNKVVDKSTTIRIVSGEVVDTARICDSCKELMDNLPSPGMTTFMQGGPNVCKK